MEENVTHLQKLHNTDLLKMVVDQTDKDLQMSMGFGLDNVDLITSPELLIESLHRSVIEILDHFPNRLDSFLYRVDVSKNLLSRLDSESEISLQLTNAVLDRITTKVVTRIALSKTRLPDT